MDFRTYFKGLSEIEQAEYAERAGTSAAYIHTHFLSHPPRRIPRPDLMRALAAATNGAVSLHELLCHFYELSPSNGSGGGGRRGCGPDDGPKHAAAG